MASYSSYKKISPDSLQEANIVDDAKLDYDNGAGPPRGQLYVYSERGFRCHECANTSGCVCQACGRCCNWTVPDRVSTATFEIWSGGGGGPGVVCCNCFQFAMGGGGGNYAQKTIETSPGCTYTVCAGGSWPCSRSHTCGASMGCKSFVQGQNLSNFCVVGGCGGIYCNGDQYAGRINYQSCANCNICGIFGADFGMMGDVGSAPGYSGCQCRARHAWTGAAPMVGKMHYSATTDWCTCGCYVNWPAGGGQAGLSIYCGDTDSSCRGGGVGQGGSGFVRITFS